MSKKFLYPAIFLMVIFVIYFGLSSKCADEVFFIPETGEKKNYSMFEEVVTSVTPAKAAHFTWKGKEFESRSAASMYCQSKTLRNFFGL